MRRLFFPHSFIKQHFIGRRQAGRLKLEMDGEETYFFNCHLIVKRNLLSFFVYEVFRKAQIMWLEIKT